MVCGATIPTLDVPATCPPISTASLSPATRGETNATRHSKRSSNISKQSQAIMGYYSIYALTPRSLRCALSRTTTGGKSRMLLVATSVQNSSSSLLVSYIGRLTRTSLGFRTSQVLLCMLPSGIMRWSLKARTLPSSVPGLAGHKCCQHSHPLRRPSTCTREHHIGRFPSQIQSSVAWEDQSCGSRVLMQSTERACTTAQIPYYHLSYAQEC